MKKRFAMFRAKEDDNRPVTKQDFTKLESSLIWPPPFTRDYDMIRAQQFREDKDDILASNSLPTDEKLRILSEIDKDYMLFKKKAQDKLGQRPHVWATSRVPVQSSREGGGGNPLRVDNITQSFTKAQKPKVENILRGMLRTGALLWTDKGEIYYPETNTIIPGSDIQSLVKYNLTTNKTQVKKPPGYDEFEDALHKSKAFQLVNDPVVVSTASVRPKTPALRPQRRIERVQSQREQAQVNVPWSPPISKRKHKRKPKSRSSRIQLFEEEDDRIETGIRRVVDKLIA